MPTTTNFGWTTPADTDLVKDGAAAIRTLGNGVDTSFLDLKGGTSGQVLSKNSNTDLDFIWIAAAGGKLKQVVQMTTSTLTSIATGTYTDTGLTLAITPTAATSKILVIADCNTQQSRAGTSLNGYARIVRTSTTIYDTHIFEMQVDGATGSIATGSHNTLVYLDSPSTTSATTYKVQGSASTGATLRFQYTSAASSLTLLEIGA